MQSWQKEVGGGGTGDPGGCTHRRWGASHIIYNQIGLEVVRGSLAESGSLDLSSSSKARGSSKPPCSCHQGGKQHTLKGRVHTRMTPPGSPCLGAVCLDAVVFTLAPLPLDLGPSHCSEEGDKISYSSEHC